MIVYSSSPIRLAGAVVGVVVVFRDVTAQKQAEEAVQRSASRLRSLIATTQDAVISIDRRGCVVLFNSGLNGFLVIPLKRLLATR